jgi:hypothetical protein
VYPVPLEEPVELMMTVGTAQVMIPPGAAEAKGGVRLVLTAAITVLVHPLFPLVTVSVYMPGVFTTGAGVLAPVTILPPWLAVQE